MLEAEMRVWNLLKELDALSDKTGEGGGKQIDYDMQRCSPDPKVGGGFTPCNNRVNSLDLNPCFETHPFRLVLFF